GMIMDRDTPADMMRAAADPRLVTASYGLAAKGTRNCRSGRWNILQDVTVEAYAYNGLESRFAHQYPSRRPRSHQRHQCAVGRDHRAPAWLDPAQPDGPAEITQTPIEPWQTYSYQFTATQHGTFSTICTPSRIGRRRSAS